MGKKRAGQTRDSARRSHEVEEAFGGLLRGAERAAREAMPWIGPGLDALRTGMVRTGEATRLMEEARRAGVSPERYGEAWAYAAAPVAVVGMWEARGRLTYDLDETLVRDLASATADSFPGEVFGQLPHINPLVVLPEPWQAGAYVLRGFYLYGLAGNGGRLGRMGTAFGMVQTSSPLYHCFTDAEDREALGALLIVDEVDEVTGEIVATRQVDVQLPTYREMFSTTDVARLNKMLVQTPDGMLAGFMRPLLSVVLYLCAENAELREMGAPSAGSGGRRRARETRELSWVGVGWRLGARLRAARARAGGQKTFVGESGIEHVPHQKAGHLKRVRYGAGHELVKVRYVLPYWVRRDLLEDGAEPVSTVRPVGGARPGVLRKRPPLRLS